MARRTPAQVLRDLLAAGFSQQSAVIEDAIAGAESGWDDAAQGDLGLTDNTWGPSFGLYQIRTLKSATGTGTDRDIAWLAASDANQAKAAYDISNAGANFGPWTTYTTGKYQQFLGQAQAAAGDSTATTAASLLPTSLAGDALTTIRGIALEALGAVLGLGLVYVGAITLVRPKVERTSAQLRQAVL
jgi:hypothetical protein